jgi:hypothetical protein
MDINLKNAVLHFYSNPSFEQIFFEAVANSLDAGADDIIIDISTKSFDAVETLRIYISDNGVGFREENFEKFSKLMEADKDGHKGLGRLVYLAYFDEIEVESYYDDTKKRGFIFNSTFAGESVTSSVDKRGSGTKISFRKFSGAKVKSYDYLRPESLKAELIRHFFPLMYKRKFEDSGFRIELRLQVDVPNPKKDFCTDTQTVTLDDVPKLINKSCSIDELDWFQSLDIHYDISHEYGAPKSIFTGICIDGRTIPYDLVSNDALPNGYQIIVLFESDFFDGKADTARQKLNLPKEMSERVLKQALRKELGLVISAGIPEVSAKNDEKKKELKAHFPHLDGYIDTETVGVLNKEEVLEVAQRKFFSDQKQILECTTLDDSLYEKALDLSARSLMEYVLYRARIIEKLKSMSPVNSEGEIHDIIVPRKCTIKSETFEDDLYTNNVWMLDDKYMSYNTILSDQEMSKVIKVIASDEVDDDTRPDITLVFSGDPTAEEKVDVVIVELKRQGLKLAKNEEVVSQLRQRARKLLKYYPDKIERIWFYGITDIDSEFRISLKEDGYKQLFSHGSMYYKSQPVIIDENLPEFPVDLYVLTYDTFINDAESRNSTFLKVLKRSIAKVKKEVSEIAN